MGFLEELAQLHGMGETSPARPPLEINPAPGLSGQIMGGGLPTPSSGFTASKVPFQQFDPKFIGTGVGHNYNGHGFYLSSNQKYVTGIRDQYHPGGAVQEAKIAEGKLFNLDAKKIDPEIASKVERFTGEKPDRFATGRDVLYQLENIPVTAYRALFKDPTISTSQQGASKFLAASGYKGNTYSDAYGEHYVIYDPKDLEVVQK